jgi:L-aspartate oxidase
MLAYQAGASLADLEFVQFHPTALSVPGQPAFLLSEALRGEGAQLLDADGNAVVDPLLPRDVVARALHRFSRTQGPVYLSLRHLDADHIHARFQSLSSKLAELGFDLARDLLPVAPAAHYCMGGIRTDSWGRTDVPGLYAAGETACTGVQGANRLASNSLLECLVFGARAGSAAVSDSAAAHADWTTRDLPERLDPPPSTHWISVIDAAALGQRLDTDLGVERGPRGVRRLVADLPTAAGSAAPDLLLSSLIARAAYLRAESRGAHFRTDFPTTRPHWRGRIHWRRAHAPRFKEVLP